MKQVCVRSRNRLAGSNNQSQFGQRWTAAVALNDTAIQLLSLQADVHNKVNFDCNFNYNY